MSGIYGIFTPGSAVCPSLAPMQKWLQDYGRHGHGEHSRPSFALGCFQQHIPAAVPMSPAVPQSGSTTAVFDALLYNRDELADLLGKDLSALSDEQVLLEVWLTHGPAGLRQVNGDFAGAVYDGQNLTLLRDHMGIRPLYWYRDEERVIFSTDQRAIFAVPGICMDINEEYLYLRLSGYVTDESEVTHFANIRAVKPGHTLTIAPDLSVKSAPYWRIGEKKIRLKNEQEYIARLRELVYDSIRRRMAVAGGKPIGADLSGGLDSTVIDVILKKLGADPLCFSWSPSLEQQPLQPNDERTVIEDTCQTFGLNNHYEVYDPAPDYQAHLDLLQQKAYPPRVYVPFVQASCEFFRSQGAPIAFSGWGGDEGVSHRSNPYELWYHKEYLSYFKLLWSRSHGWKKPLRFLKKVLWSLTKDRPFFHSNWNLYSANRIDPPQILNPAFEARWKGKAAACPEFFAFDPVTDISHGANRSRTETCALLGSEYGLQYVFPFLDYRVEDFAVSIPRRLFHKGHMERYLYREAFKAEMVPSLYTYRYKHDPGRMTLFDQVDGVSKAPREALAAILTRMDLPFWSRYLHAEAFPTLAEHQAETLTDELESCFSMDVARNL